MKESAGPGEGAIEAGGRLRSGFLWGVLIVAVGWAAYSRTLAVPFLLDDQFSIVENPSVQRWTDLDALIRPPVNAPTAGRPVANLSFALSYGLSGLQPWGHHLFNLGAHLLTCLVLFGLVRRILRTPRWAPRFASVADPWAAGVALLWGVHPAITQAVTYLSQRTEVLMGLGYVATLYGFVRTCTEHSRFWAGFTVTAGMAGALSKEVMVTVPVMVWLLDRTFFAGSWREALRRRWALYAGLAAIWPLLGWLLADVRNRGVGLEVGVSPWHYALTQCRALSLYAQRIVWPEPLVFDYGPGVVQAWADVWPEAAGIGLALVFTGIGLWRWPRLAFFPAGFFLLLAPTSSFVPVAGAPIAENRLYLPAIVLVVAGAVGLHLLVGLRHARWVVVIMVGAAVALTVRRNDDFLDALRLWRDTLAKAPENARAYENVADLLARLPGREGEARWHYQEALRRDPRAATALNNYGLLLAREPATAAQAEASYQAALRIKSDHASTYYNYALLVAGQPGRQAEARQLYETALRIKPNLAEAHINLANLLRLSGEHPAAAAHYEAALRLVPGSAQAHNNYGALLALRMETRAEAITHFEAALRADPAYVEAHNNLANLLSELPGREAAAISHYEACLRLAPAHFGAHNNLALLLARMPARQEAALAHFLTAAQLAPDNPGVHLNLARHYELLGRRVEAVATFRRAIELGDTSPAAREALARLEGAPASPDGVRGGR